MTEDEVRLLLRELRDERGSGGLTCPRSSGRS